MRVVQHDNLALSTEIGAQVSRTWSTLLVSISVGLLGVLGVYALHSYTRLPFGYFTRDPAALTHSKFYVGILSNLGIMLWSATTAICLFGAYFLSSYYNLSEFRWFLLSFGILSSMLALDDVFMIHESFFPEHLHIPEKAVSFSYAFIAAGCLIRFYKLIRNTDYFLLLLALTFLGGSVFIDAVLPNSDHEVFIEDSFKFVGIVFWIAYFFNSVVEIIHNECKTNGHKAHEH